MKNMLNENVIKGKWNELKGQLQKTWGNLTNDEIDYAQGDLKKFYGSVQSKYGQSEEEVKDRLNSIVFHDERRTEGGTLNEDMPRRDEQNPRPQ